MDFRRSIAIVVTTVGALLGSVTSVSGADVQAHTDEASYARAHDVTLDDATQRLALHGDAAKLDRQLAESEPSTFAGLWIQHQPTFRIIVLFTIDGAKTLAPYVAGTPLADLTEVRPAKYALHHLEEDLDITSPIARELGMDLSLNVMDNRLDLYPTPSSDPSELVGRMIPSSVRVDEIVRSSRPTVDIYAGLFLTTCTSGFTVYENYGLRLGITTAAHCQDAQSYNGTALTYKRGRYEKSHDEQLHGTIGFSTKPEFKTGPGSVRPVRGRVNRLDQPINGYVCKYGVSTGYTCGYIQTRQHQPSYIQDANPTFVRVAPHNDYPDMTNGGDSGGPVFLVSNAYGLVHGQWGAPWCECDLIYTAINFVENGLDVTLLLE